jgi:hypothetical protein
VTGKIVIFRAVEAIRSRALKAEADMLYDISNWLVVLEFFKPEYHFASSCESSVGGRCGTTAVRLHSSKLNRKGIWITPSLDAKSGPALLSSATAKNCESLATYTRLGCSRLYAPWRNSTHWKLFRSPTSLQGARLVFGSGCNDACLR